MAVQPEDVKGGESGFRHHMIREIHEQAEVIDAAVRLWLQGGRVVERAFGSEAPAIFDRVRAVHITACGTSYHAGLVARYWIEHYVGIPCVVEVASEFRFRQPALVRDTLLVTLSQSGETTDTLGALEHAAELPFLATLAICNVPDSSLVRNSDLYLITEAGPEIGVASTKAFTTQLVALLLLTMALGRRNGLSPAAEAEMVAVLAEAPRHVQAVLALDEEVQQLATHFSAAQHALFLGRGALWPIAMEGALKLKETSYIHAEAYPTGELRHGPMALVDETMPVVMLVPCDNMLTRARGVLADIRSRGGMVYVLADRATGLTSGERQHVVSLPPIPELLSPLIQTIPLQLLAYHVAVLKGTNVDQPRNLSKAVIEEE